MKKLVVLFLIAALLLSLAACGNETAPPPSGINTPTPTSTTNDSSAASGTEDQPDVEISGDLYVWIGFEPLAEAIIEGFNNIYPNVNVRYDIVGLDVDAKLALDGPSGVGPDVFSVGHTAISLLVADGLAEPFPASLQDMVKDVMIDSTVSTGTVNGTVYGVPYSVEPVILLYNKDLIDAPPATMEEIIETAKTYNDPAAGKYFMRWALDGYHNYIFPSAFGFKVFGPNGDDWKNPGLDSPEMAKGLAYYASMRSVFDVNYGDADWNTTIAAFHRGETPLCISGPWGIAGCKDAGLNFGTSKIPTINGVQPNSLSGIMLAAVSSYAKNFDAAFAFVEYMASVEVANMIYGVYGSVPALKDLTGVKGIAEDEWIVGMADQAQYTDAAPTIPEVKYLWEPWGEMSTFVWDGVLSIEEAQDRAMEMYEILLNAGGLSRFD
ncbi:MAG: maltose ABC transporter substrate-binding protein [Oscillospiraceae bacterium]|nr:maltose ABC transporter substrate-binding protein [Oscillospiraceae bacterium]